MAKAVEFILGLAQMETKGFRFSGQKPPEAVRNNNDTVGLVGLHWDMEHDAVFLEPKPLYFGKTSQGRRPPTCCMAAVLLGWLMAVLKDQVQKRIFVTNSSISLSWISRDERLLEPGVRNVVIEIRRFCDLHDWFHVAGVDIIANLGTRFATVDKIWPG